MVKLTQLSEGKVGLSQVYRQQHYSSEDQSDII